MPETKRKPRTPRTAPPRPQPLTVIEGALSIYRPGDKVIFTLEGVEHTGIVDKPYEYDDGRLFVAVTLSLGVNAQRIQRVERAGNEVSR